MRNIFPFMVVLMGVWVGSCNGGFFNPTVSHAPKFPDSQLYAIDVGLGPIQGRVVSFADFNSDKYPDMIVLSHDRTTVTIHIWDDDKFSYFFAENAVIGNLTDIVSVQALDYNYDGKLDLMVSTQGSGDKPVDHTVYLGDRDKFSGTFDKSTFPVSADQLSIFDGNNDLHVDFFGETVNGQRSYWIWDDPPRLFPQPEPKKGLRPLARGYSNAFVDLDGDCIPDLVVVSEDKSTGTLYMEVWHNTLGNQEAEGYTLDQEYSLPPGTGQLTFADMDGDGAVDLLFPVCYPAGSCSIANDIHILYNRAFPYCGTVATPQDGCRKRKTLCSSSPEYGFDAPNGLTQGKNHVIVPTPVFGSDRAFVVNHPLSPLRVRVGDYDLDGYPDALVALRDNSATGQGKSYIALLHSQQCSDATKVAIKAGGTPTKCDGQANERRTLRLVENGVDQLTSIDNAFAAAFIDLGDKGTLDIVIMTDPTNDPKTGNALPTIQAVFNNFFTDAFFVKTMGLNGVCPAWCKSGAKFPKPKPYGGIQYGVAWKYTITDLNSKRRVVAGAQLTQSSYGALELPYILFGLGRANNYMDELWMGVPLAKSGTTYGMWRGIIPNSQLAATPYERDAAPFWDMWLFISPSANAFWVFLGCVVTLAATGVASLFLKWREVREDRREDRENMSTFSFQAL